MDKRAVIFDMDGVLVDSYHAHFESWRRLAAEQGFEFTEEEFARTFGRTSREIIRETWPMELTDEQIAEADQRKEAFYREIIRKSFPEMPGARDLIRSLHAAGFALAVGSSGPAENVAVALEGLGLGDLFAAKVTGHDVTHGKPHPEVFLVAADRLGVPAACCAVVEDAPAGVEAANRADMTAVAITGTAPREKLRAARVIVDHLSELSPERFAELIDHRGA